VNAAKGERVRVSDAAIRNRPLIPTLSPVGERELLVASAVSNRRLNGAIPFT